MAINAPQISFLRGYDSNPDIVGKFGQGFDLSRNIIDQQQARDLLSQFADTLYSGKPAQPQSLADLAPMVQGGGNAVVNGSFDAASGAQDPKLTAYFAAARNAESGGNDAARNPNSTATGRYQFLEGTWNDIAQRYPELGLTPDGRNDPNQQERAMKVFTAENARTLAKSGVPVNPGSLYAAHFLGAGGASKVLGQDPATPLTSVLDPQTLAANPNLNGMTVGEFTNWANSKGGNGSGGYKAPPAQPQGNGLPPQELMQGLLSNPQTREFAQSLVAKATAVTPPTSEAADVQTYRLYRQEEMTAGRQPLSFIDFKRAIASKDGFAIQTNPDGSVSIQQGNAPGNMKLTEAQGKDVGFYTRGLDANTQLSTMDTTLTDWGQSKADLVPLGLGNYLRTPEFRQAKVAADSFLTAILRKDTGAGVTNAEFELYGPMFLPVPGDDQSTIETKRRAREVALLGIRSGLGTAEAVAEANRIAMGGSPATPILDAAKGGGAPQGGADQPPAGWSGDPALWQFMTSEERALWN